MMTGTSSIKGAHLRIARPTNDLNKLVAFYRDGLGFEVVGSFEGHSGFDGVMLGHPEAGYHLEFTHEPGQQLEEWRPTSEHLLVFYLPNKDEWQALVRHLDAFGSQRVSSHNPYWDSNGVTFLDPDGYRIVLQNQAWPIS